MQYCSKISSGVKKMRSETKNEIEAGEVEWGWRVMESDGERDDGERGREESKDTLQTRTLQHQDSGLHQQELH
jgi:hypothetical protein